MDLVLESSSLILLPEGEDAHPMDLKLKQLSESFQWRWENGSFACESLGETDSVFLVADGNLDPVDQIEAMKDFMESNDLDLGRILTVVHCALAEVHDELHAWYQGCIHFSDVVLLNRREGVSQKWIREFQNGFRQEYFPCFFELVKKGRVDNPVHVLDPTPRRLSQHFDEKEDSLLDEEEDHDDSGIKSDFPDGDPFLLRYSNGKRCKPLPDPASILASKQSRSA